MENLEFKVEGSYLTNEARKRYQETADINDGVSFLQSCLIGIPAEYALQVVIGKAKLTGVGVEVYLEEDNEEILPFKLRRPNKPEDVDCGWISPEGFIYGKRNHTSTDDHIQIAEELVEGLVVKKEGLANAYELVEKAGFVKFAPFDIIAGRKGGEQRAKNLAKAILEREDEASEANAKTTEANEANAKFAKEDEANEADNVNVNDNVNNNDNIVDKSTKKANAAPKPSFTLFQTKTNNPIINNLNL